MARYLFTVKDNEGNRKSGTLEAASSSMAMKILAEKDMIVTTLTPIKTRRESLKVSGENLLLFTQELGSMLKAGIALKRSLEVIATDLENPALRQIALELSSGLSSGGTLSELMKQYPNVFSNLYVSMVEAGEAGGKLPALLLRLGDYIENSLNLKKKIQSQLYYPAIVICSRRRFLHAHFRYSHCGRGICRTGF